MTLTTEQKNQLKKNVLSIKNYLLGLVEGHETAIYLHVKFGGRSGISVDKLKTSKGFETEVRGYIGGLSLTFEEDAKDSFGSHKTAAWEYNEYGITLCEEWPYIKNQMNLLYQEEKRKKELIMNFQL